MRILLLFIFAIIHSSESDPQLHGECKLRTTVDCGDNSNGPNTNSGRSNLLAGAGLPGKRGQKGVSGKKGSSGAKGDVGPKGLKGNSCAKILLYILCCRSFASIFLVFVHKKANIWLIS